MSTLEERRKILKEIKNINKKIGFVGNRGEQNLNDDNLKQLLAKLKEKHNV